MSGADGRILDKSNYSSETLNTYGFLSCYFIDLFYNHLYDQAIRLYRDRQVGSVTDGYRHTLDAFVKSIKKQDPELFRDLVGGIYEMFMGYGYHGMTYQNCIDKVVKEFVPQDYWATISFDDKSKILGIIITNSSLSMIQKILSGRLSDVIDAHGEVENTNVWQDEFVDILILEREKFYQQFVNVKTGNLSGDVVELMKKEIKLLYEDKHKLSSEILEHKKKIQSMNKVILTKHKQLTTALLRCEELEHALSQYTEPQHALSQYTEPQHAASQYSTAPDPTYGHEPPRGPDPRRVVELRRAPEPRHESVNPSPEEENVVSPTSEFQNSDGEEPHQLNLDDDDDLLSALE